MPKTASLVFFYFGESSYMRRLAQETVPLHLALTGYDHRVLLRHETDFGPFELSERAERKANVLDIPTKGNLVEQLNRLGEEGYVTDLYIFSHGFPDGFRVSNGEYGQNTVVRQRFLEYHTSPLKLRMVWQCNCYGSTMNDAWRNLGARVTAGSRFVNFYPTRFRGFMQRWNKGETFGRAIAKSDTKAVHTPAQTFMLLDALGRRKRWGGCPAGQTVLGRGDCARDYFETCWFREGQWQEGKTGKQNMNHASRMLISGNRKTTKKTVW